MAPPEQLWGRAVAASDLYALGATLIHLLTGIAPSDLPQQQMCLQFADKVSINSNFAQWLERLTYPAPERRFSTARQALLALQTPNIKSENPGESAKNSVRYGRLAGLVCLQFVIFGLPVLIALPSFLARSNPSQERESRNFVTAMNRAQQAYYLKYGKLSYDNPKLAFGITGPKTQNYIYFVGFGFNTVFTYAQSRKSDAKSYVGAVTIIVDQVTGEKVTEAILCEARSPGLHKIKIITRNVFDEKVTCPSDTKQINE